MVIREGVASVLVPDYDIVTVTKRETKMPRRPTLKTGPRTPAERQRDKRARDRETVWSGDGDESALSDSGLIEQLRIAFAKDRQTIRGGRQTRSTGAITRGLLREIERRIA